MDSNNILILGDSTSMSIGLERKAYPFLLADARVWPQDTKIVNCAIPGFTSADGAAFFFRHEKSLRESLRAVIIYLGNCDAASSEVRKGRFSPLVQWKHKIREAAGRRVEKGRLKNRLLHFEWNNAFDPLIESSERSVDFEYNIARILERCQRERVPVILVRPKANQYFPPGVGKGNFVFYRYLGMKDCLSNLVSIPDTRFKEALGLHEAGRYSEAADIYKVILLQPPLVSMNQEYPLVVVNNYASARAEAGEVEEAAYLFHLLLKEMNVRREIVLFNLAQIERRRGNESGYKRLIEDSYESDDSLYRIRAPYVRALDELARRYPSAHLLDMSGVFPDAYFLDHCHMLPEGQAKLADEVQQKLTALGITGNNQARIENVLYNPELARGNVSEFHDYFKTFAPLTEKQVAEAIRTLALASTEDATPDWSAPELAKIPREVQQAVDYYLRHPCFTSVRDIASSPPRFPSDVGRFPEYFLVRHLVPYLRLHEENPRLYARFSGSPGVLRTSKQLTLVLPAQCAGLVESVAPTVDPACDETRLELIIAKVRTLLLRHLQKGNQIHERTKTTIFWYVRESLRFGAHSRRSMLYDRVLLEFLAEGLAVAGVLDFALGMTRSAEIEGLIDWLERSVTTHENYCGRFSLSDSDSSQLLADYDQELKRLANNLEAAVAAEKTCIS